MLGRRASRGRNSSTKRSRTSRRSPPERPPTAWSELKLHDQHLHSWHSVDSKANPRANCKQALAAGLTGLTFTEHYDPHPADWKHCSWDYAAISDTVTELREQYQPRLQIGLGIEVDYQPALIEATVEYLGRYQFDVVLLSVHWADDRPLHLPGKWRRGGAAAMTAAYQAALGDAMARVGAYADQGERPFDVLGHLDLCARYEHNVWGEVVPLDPIWLDEMLQLLLAAEVVPEVNTSGLRQGLGRTMPASTTLTRYRELGGRYISIGSDAHQSPHIGADFAAVAAELVGLGFDGEAVYQGRVQTVIPF